MRAISFALLALAVPVLALPASGRAAESKPSHPAAKPAAKSAAAKPTAEAPKSIGVFNDWQAATHQESGQTVCYAFTRPTASSPSVAGRSDVVLSVSERPSGRDAVAISAGFTYPAKSTVTVKIDQTSLDFYTAGRAAFARDGHEAVAAFQKGAQAVAKSPSPHGDVSDTFSLKGFSAAYAAITKACPAH